MATEITKVTTDQIEDLIEISRETFTDTFGSENTPADLAEYLDTAYSNKQLLSEINNPNSSFWFIYVDGKIAGYLKLNVADAQSEDFGTDSLEIERIYVRMSFKRQGLGTQLYDLALEKAAELKKNRIILGVWEHNEPAQKFYQKLGFHRIGEHVFQLGDDAQTDFIMEKNI